jgi:hypothetical protein
MYLLKTAYKEREKIQQDVAIVERYTETHVVGGEMAQRKTYHCVHHKPHTHCPRRKATPSPRLTATGLA